MADAISQKLLDERDDVIARANGLKKTALSSYRDLSEGARETLSHFQSRVAEIDTQLKYTTMSYDLDEPGAPNRPRINGPAPVMSRDGNPWEGQSAGQV